MLDGWDSAGAHGSTSTDVTMRGGGGAVDRALAGVEGSVFDLHAAMLTQQPRAMHRTMVRG